MCEKCVLRYIECAEIKKKNALKNAKMPVVQYIYHS